MQIYRFMPISIIDTDCVRLIFQHTKTEMAAVLSLNGKPQVTLRLLDQQQFAEEQHQLNGGAAVTVGLATQQIMQVLGALARIKISDGRIVVGRLHCFDKHQNVILTDAREFPPLFGPERPISSSKQQHKQQQQGVNGQPQLSAEEEDAAFEKHRSETTSRSLGMTLVPGKHIVYIKVQKASS